MNRRNISQVLATNGNFTRANLEQLWKLLGYHGRENIVEGSIFPNRNVRAVKRNARGKKFLNFVKSRVPNNIRLIKHLNHWNYYAEMNNNGKPKISYEQNAINKGQVVKIFIGRTGHNYKLSNKLLANYLKSKLPPAFNASGMTGMRNPRVPRYNTQSGLPLGFNPNTARSPSRPNSRRPPR